MKQIQLNVKKKSMTKKSMTNKKEQPDEVDSELQNIVEAALFAAKKPLGIRNLVALFPDDAQPTKVEIQNAIISLEDRCEFRGIELRRIGKGWRFQSKEKYATWLRKVDAHKAPRYSRALLETLSIIAYRQPVTRGDIEEIRGVGVSSETIRTLEEREWVSQIGHRDVPGRPALFGTTQMFLEYFNMQSLRELPELMNKRELGEIAKEMNLTLPMDGVQNEDDAAAEQGRLSELAEQDEQAKPKAEVVELRPSETTSTEEVSPEQEHVDTLEVNSKNTEQDSLENRESANEPSDHER